jgi:hypothetical protein
MTPGAIVFVGETLRHCPSRVLSGRIRSAHDGPHLGCVDPNGSTAMDVLEPGRGIPANWRARSPHLTDRDIDIIRWITRHGVVTADLVGRRFFWRPQLQTYGRRATYRRLNALCRLGLILDKREYGTPHNVVRTTRAGSRLADVAFVPLPLSFPSCSTRSPWSRSVSTSSTRTPAPN